VWKEHAVLKKIDEQTAAKFIEVLGDVFRVIRMLSAVGLEDEVFKIASEENITVYDASYLCLAIKNKLTLVTDDRKLREASSKIRKHHHK